MELVKNIAAIVGCVLSCISLATLCIKPIRKKIVNMITSTAGVSETSETLKEMRQELALLHNKMDAMQKQHKEDNEKIHEEISKIVSDEQTSEKALKDMIRKDIVDTYYSNLNDKQLHYEEWETVNELANSYFDLNGNHFVQGLMDQMSNWEIIQ